MAETQEDEKLKRGVKREEIIYIPNTFLISRRKKMKTQCLKNKGY